MKSEDIKKEESDTLLLQLRKDNSAEDPNSTQSPPSPPVFFSKRLAVAVLLFFGHVTVALGSQVTNIAVIEMRSKNQSSRISFSDTYSNPLAEFLLESPQFQWDPMTVGMILNMFWYGCLFTPIGGILAHKFGGAVTMGTATLLASITVLLSPLGLRIHLYLFMACRVFVGLFQGFSCASCTPIFAHWIPKRERSTFVSSIVNGFYFGNALTFILCGFLAHHWGWPMAYYGAGILCFVWSILWLFFVTNDPADDKIISKSELAYIKKETGNISASTNNDRPFKAILSSAPFWALTSCKFAYGWGQAFAVANCPIYIKDATQTNINIIGYLSSVPNLANIVILPLAGILLSYVQKRTKLRDNLIHKSILCTGFVICAVSFALITTVNSFIVSMTCLVIINVLISYDRIIYELITVNMAPNHTSLISGLSLFGQTSGTIIAQLFIGYVVQNHDLQEWNTCFLWSACVLLFVAFVYLIFGSSETQPWSVSSPSREAIQEFKIAQNNQNITNSS